MIKRLEKLSAWFVLTSGKTRYAIAFLAGLASALSMAPFDAFPILFFTLPIFIWLLDGAFSDAREGVFTLNKTSFLIGWWFGFGYFVAGLWWIANALLVDGNAFAWAVPLAVIALPAGLAIFWGFAAMAMRWFWSEDWTRVLIFAVFLSLFEYLRGTLFTGFPWNTLGYAAMTFPVTMQSVSVIGLYGITFFAVIIFASPLIALSTSNAEGGVAKKLLALSFILAITHVGYGAYRLSNNPTQYVEDVSLRLVQPNINQADKFKPENSSKILGTYLRLSSKAGIEKTTHVIWPESAFPFFLTERRDALAAIAAMLPDGTQLITGAVRAEPSAAGNPYGYVYNTTYSINSEGEIQDAADKVHLVPFGEYLPFQETLEAFGLRQVTRMRGGFKAGVQRRLLDGGIAGAFLPLICYEIIFSGEAGEYAGGNNAQARWIVNVTNDAWYGKTPGPYQHSRQSIIRGVEIGLPVIRVANSGISTVSDPFGRITNSIPLGIEGILDSKLPTSAKITIFSTYGMFPFFALLLCIFSFCFFKVIFNKH